MIVYLAWKETRPQYGEERLIGIFSTKELADFASFVEANTLPGYQTRVQEVLVHEDKEPFAKKWMDK